ncbi:hypothetical protein BJ138DRAFT_1157601 [Hygrophoropsis aurantiaca]|uniref:Uncharacterized protein n=1 Tax=Hygrophoropsis aurantiaca TaxID=72124 RepID=A0ACB8A550_9AGAM|nr:hypothetical protein BJ138DRAFT_1157601 [Hygrophoropsis aurantiaca]
MSAPAQKLEYAPLSIGKASHKDLDTLVLPNLVDLEGIHSSSELSLEDLTVILISVMRYPPNNPFFDPTFRKTPVAKQLLENHLELQEAIREAFATRSFETIRNIRNLWSPQARAVTPHPSKLQETAQKNEKGQAILRAWSTPYFGRHHYILLKNINAMARTAHYSNSVAILQSSGSGKSRMVREQANLVFTIPFNLRSDSESKDLAYPHPDKEVRRYFCIAAEESLVDAQIRVLLFFRTLFREVAVALQSLLGQQTVTNDVLAERWIRYLEEDQNRTQLYGKVVAYCKSHLLSSIEQNNGVPIIEGCPTSQAAREELIALLAIIDKCRQVSDSNLPTSRQPVKLMMYFDEAHELATNRVENDPDKKDMYDVICSCLNFFLQQSIFAIFLSTNASIHHLAPHGSLARSARARSDTAKSQAPISETPFDCTPNLIIEPRQYTLEDVCKVKFMAMFGRPLFWTLWQNIKVVGDGTRDKLVIEFAGSKLICAHDFRVAHKTVSLDVRTAVLDVLLMLDYEPLREKARVQQATLVESDMRIAYSVPNHREYFRSGYPSEPILAEAAARQMDEFMQRSPNEDVMASILEEQFTSGILDLGQRGEIVMRLLLMKAYLKAVRADHQRDSEVTFSKGCSLVTFVSELFTDRFSSDVLSSTPDKMVDGVAFADAFKNSVVRFTHFVKAADDSATTTFAMFAAFVRGMAMVGHSSQEMVDIVIPILLKRNDRLAEPAMTALLVQVKRRAQKGTPSAYAIEQSRIRLFPAGSEDARPYITLVAELGVQPPSSNAATTDVLVTKKLSELALGGAPPSTPVKPKTQGKSTKPPTSVAPETPSTLRVMESPSVQHHSVDPHRRYSVFAYGCSNTVYKVIPAHARSKYGALLATRHILDEHPRQDVETLNAVRTMKPFWNAGLECYHWINEPYLKKFLELEEREMVVVGSSLADRDVVDEVEVEDKDKDDEDEDGDEDGDDNDEDGNEDEDEDL